MTEVVVVVLSVVVDSEVNEGCFKLLPEQNADRKL